MAKKKQDVVYSDGPNNWVDNVWIGGKPSWSNTFTSPVRYPSLDYDYSETTAQWQQRRKTPGVFVPPTNVHTSDRRGIPREFEVSVEQPSYGSKREYKGYLFPPLGALLYHGITSFDWNDSLLKAQGQLRGTKVNLGEAFAEAGQTAHMISNSILRISEIARDLRKGRFRNPFSQGSQIAADFGELWLEYKYGWLPLAQDAYGVYELHRDRDKKRPYTVCGKGSSNSEETGRGVALDLYDYWGTRAAVHWVATAKKRSKTKLYFKVDYDAQTWQRQTAIDNPGLILWETLPYSHVADWFLPMGNYLNALGYAEGLSFLGGFTTVVSEVSTEYEAEQKNSGVGIAYARVNKSPCVQSKYHRRVKYVTAPMVPPPWMAMDPNALSRGTRVIEAASMLLQLLRGDSLDDVPTIRY